MFPQRRKLETEQKARLKGSGERLKSSAGAGRQIRIRCRRRKLTGNVEGEAERLKEGASWRAARTQKPQVSRKRKRTAMTEG